jgi:hypothetical protein
LTSHYSDRLLGNRFEDAVRWNHCLFSNYRSDFSAITATISYQYMRKSRHRWISGCAMENKKAPAIAGASRQYRR